jgi:hypothetical protein
MKIKINVGLLIDGLEVLVPVAKAVPVMGAPFEGALEAAKQILKYAEVSTSDQQAEGARCITVLQQVKSNKEESLALAKYIGETTPKLFLALQSLDDVDSMKSSIEDFVKYVTRPDHLANSFKPNDRILESIATFLKQQTTKSMGRRVLRKQSDADEIKKWEKEVMRAYESFNVCNGAPCWQPVNSTSIDRSTRC